MIYTIIQYGFLVFRGTALDDIRHAEFAKAFGPLDKLKIPGQTGIQTRFATDELMDQGNLDLKGNVLPAESPKAQFNRGNLLFHVDMSYNPQRVTYSMLRAAAIPPPGSGGDTVFCDVRQAWDDLPEEWKKELLDKDYRVDHSMWYSRKLASPEYFGPIDHAKYPSSRRRLVQTHPRTGRTFLYEASHIFRIDGLPEAESRAKLDFLWAHCTQDKYCIAVPWLGVGDLVLWDNRGVMHRGTPVEGGHARDMRRATVLDDNDGPDAWSDNAATFDHMGFWAAAFSVMAKYNVDVQEAAKAQLGISGKDVAGLDKLSDKAPPAGAMAGMGAALGSFL